MKKLSLLTVLMLSSSMVNAGWNFYPRIDDIPKGDCLEMMCDFGCAEDSQGQGRCCPKPENYSEDEEGNCVEDIIEDGCLKKKKKECLSGQYCDTFSKTCKTIPTCNECQKFDMQTGGFVPDTTKNNQQVQDACHVCQNGQVSLKDSSKTIPCGTQCCSSNQFCNLSNNTCYSCPYKVGEIVYSKKTPGSATFNPECSGKYEVVAIGGGGGNSIRPSRGELFRKTMFSGGGAAGSAKGILNVSIGDSFKVTIGAGGAGHEGVGKAGDGGTTTVGSFITCYGGKGGYAIKGVGVGGSANATTPLIGIETFTGQSGAIAHIGDNFLLSDDDFFKTSGASVGVSNYSSAGYSVPFCIGRKCKNESSRTDSCYRIGFSCKTGTGEPGYVHFKYLGK